MLLETLPAHVGFGQSATMPPNHKAGGLAGTGAVIVVFLEVQARSGTSLVARPNSFVMGCLLRIRTWRKVRRSCNNCSRSTKDHKRKLKSPKRRQSRPAKYRQDPVRLFLLWLNICMFVYAIDAVPRPKPWSPRMPAKSRPGNLSLPMLCRS